MEGSNLAGFVEGDRRDRFAPPIQPSNFAALNARSWMEGEKLPRWQGGVLLTSGAQVSGNFSGLGQPPFCHKPLAAKRLGRLKESAHGR